LSDTYTASRTVKVLRQLPESDIECVLTEGIISWPESRRNIVRLYHIGRTLTEAGACAGVTRARASQVILKFLRVCRHPSNWKKISEQSRLALLQ
jgi:DNA-directed RNA polymerase specialized sigma subunit